MFSVFVLENRVLQRNFGIRKRERSVPEYCIRMNDNYFHRGPTLFVVLINVDGAVVPSSLGLCQKLLIEHFPRVGPSRTRAIIINKYLKILLGLSGKFDQWMKLQLNFANYSGCKL